MKQYVFFCLFSAFLALLYLIYVYILLSGKEARKKELKKNKRQRQMVRAAVLKMKDPTQILEELQKIDEMGT